MRELDRPLYDGREGKGEEDIGQSQFLFLTQSKRTPLPVRRVTA